MVTKKQKSILESVDRMTDYSLSDAVKILQEHKSPKFDESLDVAIKLGVDGNKSDQNVRGALTLPNSLGKEVVVAVFADGDAAENAKSAGADFIGMDDLSEKFTKNEIAVDVVISTQAAMKVVQELGLAGKRAGSTRKVIKGKNVPGGVLPFKKGGMRGKKNGK